LVFLTIIFTFENTKITTLKTGKPINISKSFFGKPPGFNVEFGICSNSGKQGKYEKKYNNFGGLTSCRAFKIDLKY
jgi:hypothetical protein